MNVYGAGPSIRETGYAWDERHQSCRILLEGVGVWGTYSSLSQAAGLYNTPIISANRGRQADPDQTN
ncbi:hypothetical protein RRG08_013142 [Elysia crispata]|uniref:Uncharacterized protein n=1 Tax=Elysia crispata TaxID=231223 RepID=A0AAE1A0U8_9GAST|nr:hypothetical protein RRG08_013142 [Elysia crispata]